MRHPPETLRTTAVFVLAAVTLSSPVPARADALAEARIVVDVSTPPPITVRHELHWTAEGGKPRTELSFHLARALEVTGAESEGAQLVFRAEDVTGAPMRRWTVKLPSALPPGATRPIAVTARASAGAPGIRVGADGGYLLPGSGWFPSLAPEADELPPHTTEFVLPVGHDGIACGTREGNETAWTAPAGRPYAVWGAYRASTVRSGGVMFTLWRRKGASDPPRLPVLAKLVDALAAGVGEAPGSGPWKLVDVGPGVVAGGQRTLFWDDHGVAAAKPDSPSLLDRDLAAGLAAAHWAEALRFGGDQAAFLGGGISRYLGDAAAVSLDVADDRWRTEAKLVGARRAAFVASRSGDRALAGLSPRAADAAGILDGRGALVAHMAAEACPSRSHWIVFLRDFRARYRGKSVTAKELWSDLDGRFPNQHVHLRPLLQTMDLPDFALLAHGPAGAGQADRCKIDVVNRGRVGGWVEVATYDADDHPLRSTRLLVPAGENRSVLMGDAGRIARIRLDPRGTGLQSAVANEEAARTPAESVDTAAFTPAFSFHPGEATLRRVSGLDLALEGVTVRGFTGTIAWYETHHGPSGAVLLGKAKVEIAPGGEFAERFRAGTGKDRLVFQAEDLFVRFPPAVWETVRPAIGAPVDDAAQADLVPRRQFVYEHSFPTFFREGSLAQVPPPGAALVIFGIGGGEWRGFVRQPLPDGRTLVRVWDHLRGVPIWEATL